ncbi:Hypothetical predicted protein [Paramuricea clavata]|uniref:Uncharacterized protein n=1 Tax=Paramuricea clavata TaxID=317549 RepID=A0A7D9JC51_PARCT|nr:Hypothetical predicted protein [Paramuricea clavata]
MKSFLVSQVLLRILVRVVKVMFKQKWQPLERMYAVASESAEVRPISPVVNMLGLDEDEVDLDDDAASFPHSETKRWTQLLR